MWFLCRKKIVAAGLQRKKNCSSKFFFYSKKERPDNLFLGYIFYRKVFLFRSDSEDSFRVKSTRENIQYCVYFPTSDIRAKFYCLGIVVGVGLKMEESSGAAMIRLTSSNYSIWKPRMEDTSVGGATTHRALGWRSDNPVSPGEPRFVDNPGSNTIVR